MANEGLRPEVPLHCPFSDLMTRCWAENPYERLGFNEVVSELNRISIKLEEEKAQDMAYSHNISAPKQQHQVVLEDIAEETPLIKLSRKIDTEDDRRNAKKANIFTTLLRNKK